ncbi:MAG TPA: DUF4097 family beta strand repeat-containing protein [Blastocatellia bacterium]|nr:DUF4097 family beta strand repeat-containing protein [Blastocatellia bacterium]
MADNCKGCGAEIYAGQRFCRMCGRPTGDLPDEHAPTQNMPPPDQGPYPGWQGPPRQSPAATAPAQRPETAPVYPAQQPAYYQGGPPYMAQPPMYAPPKSGSKLGWVFAFIGIGVFGTIVFAILLIAARHRPPRYGPQPPPPPSYGGVAGEMPMDETTAVNTPTQTVITKTIPVGPGASLTIQNTNGRIHIESGNGPGIEVKVTKTGATDGMRRRVQIFQQLSGNKLSLRSGGPSNNGVQVAYDIQIPKAMGSVNVTTTNGSIKLDGISGDITTASKNGDIDLNNINGTASAETTNGSISAVFDEFGEGKPTTFKALNGSISLMFKSDVNANLKASTTTGSINVDPAFGVEVKKGFVGATAEGPLGTGGQPLRIDNINGSILIKKAPETSGK